MILYNSNGMKRTTLEKQKGATLMTSLVFLVLMTVVSVSATKVSILDLLVSGNNQEAMVLYQSNENELKKLADILVLGPILNNGNPDDPTIGNGADVNQFVFDDPALLAKGHTLKITDYSNGNQNLYNCGRDGVGTSLGPNAVKCRLFDFEVNSRTRGTSSRDVHHDGSGKMVPNPNKGVL